ncbi:MAG: insulinase family protein [Treponema sp.]|nr:insulinase family protein [Treponema sp.]
MFDFLDEENIGKEYGGFVLIAIDDLKDYKSKGVFMRHKRTGLELYHVVNDDRENTFAFAFRTFAKDSKGCAHIMEHSVLCGSEKYPLKEPFITLASTSLSSFLNAMTYPDKTVYPGASVVRADYFNMMDVYADAVFFPKLDYETFIQEGHRLEMDENGKTSIQGVVYNEMKGNYSAFRDVAVDRQISSMFPNSFVAYDSGGDPEVIPSLTYQEFLDFHQKFYSPDNCLLYLHGNIPTSDQIDFLNERFMSRIERKYNCNKDIENYTSKLPLVKKEVQELQQLKNRRESCEIRQLAPETGSTGLIVTMNWYSGSSNIEKYFLSEVLCGNDSAPLSYKLKESGLGDDLSPLWNNFGQLQEEFFCYGLSGVKKGDEEKVYQLITKSIQEIYDEGISQEDVDSAVMGIDFNLREVTRYWGPYSLVIMEKVLKGWNYGKTCSDQLTPITSFEEFKERLRADKDLPRKLIKKYFLDKDVVIKYVAEPSAEFLQKRNEAEAQLIKKLDAAADKDKLKKDLDKLHAYQQHVESPEETECMPTVKLAELDPKVEITNTKIDFVEGFDGSKVPLFINEEATNGIFYIDVMFPFDRLAPSDYRYIPFLSGAITNMGWDGKDWDQCITESSCVMGDVWGRVSTGVVSDCEACKEIAEKYKDLNIIGRKWLGISCKALTSMSKESLDLLAKIITSMSFDDEKRFENLLGEMEADKKASFISSGREYSLRRTNCMKKENHALNEIMWGISQLIFALDYKKHSAAENLKELKRIYDSCLASGGIIHITADKASLDKLLPMLKDFAKSAKITKLLPGIKYPLEEYQKLIYQKEAIENNLPQLIKVDSQTGYAAATSSASTYLTKESTAEGIFANWVSTHTFWDKLRTTGGAYGAGMWIDSIQNSVYFTTYRDPTPERSIKVFADSMKELAKSGIPSEDVERTVVTSYSDLIQPSSPRDKAARSFEGLLFANPSELRQKRVDNILSIKEEDVKAAAKRIAENVEKEYKSAVFCDKSKSFSGNIINLPL